MVTTSLTRVSWSAAAVPAVPETASATTAPAAAIALPHIIYTPKFLAPQRMIQTLGTSASKALPKRFHDREPLPGTHHLAPTYKTVKGILAAGTETDPPPPSTGDGGAGAAGETDVADGRTHLITMSGPSYRWKVRSSVGKCSAG
ncbi:hypothetical protein Misp02_68840 [Microtetraspora sp. NBRC 16547]|nr:hypothetical protein Misp02_68840 [Microtetraspora sp. NBRC 16547]